MVAHRCVLEAVSGMAARRAAGRPRPRPARAWSSYGGGCGQPRVTADAAKARLANIVQADRELTLGLSHAIHAGPGGRLQEHRAAALMADIIEGRGFAVRRGAGSLPTAISETYQGGLGRTGRAVGVLAEYDALPGLGHGCGHNTMAASGVGAAMALAGMATTSGAIVFLGTPAEEAGSGKG